RIKAAQERIALIEAKPEHGNDADVAHLGMAGGYGAGHIADIPKVHLSGQHPIDDDCTLQANLKINLRALRQIFLVELFAAHDHAGPRLRVVGLVPHHELYRASWLSVVLDFLGEPRLCASKHAADACEPTEQLI